MYSRVLTASLYGLESDETWVEVDVENGLPGFSIVGLANQSIREAKERIGSALKNSGFSFVQKKITVNLTPANMKKEGSHYDVAIAVGLLVSTGQLGSVPEDVAFLGELTLSGEILPAAGVLPMMIGLQRQGVRTCVISEANMSEAELVKGMRLFAAGSLKDVADFLKGARPGGDRLAEGLTPELSAEKIPDFSDIRGQTGAKRAAQVAAAGMHGLLMTGPPGAGKSMVGRRLPGLLPPLTYEERLEVTQIYSVAGELGAELPMVVDRPFRAPHHSVSAVALIGGGPRPRPGEISLAHRGVLFLDELPEFQAHTLDMLRQPLEEGKVSIIRIGGRVIYPADFMLAAAMNPCRCGYFGDPEKACTCTDSDRRRYVSRISGPLLDRIDLHVRVERIGFADIDAGTGQTLPTQDTAGLREGVMRALEAQNARFKDQNFDRNARIPARLINRYCGLNIPCTKLAREAYSKWRLSARTYHSILKIARTVADIEGSENIKEDHLLEALSYRRPDIFET